MPENGNIENKFDELFRENLNNIEIPAPQGAWESISQNLSMGQTATASSSSQGSLLSGVSTIAKVAIISGIAAVTGITAYFVSQNNKESNTKIETIDDVQLNETEDFSNDSYSENSKTDESSTFSNSEESTYEKSNSETEIINSHSTNNNVVGSNQNSNSEINNLNNENKAESNIQHDSNIPNIINESEKTENVVPSPIIILNDTVICYNDNLKASDVFGNLKVKEVFLFTNGEKVSFNAKDLASSLNSFKITANTIDSKSYQRKFRIVKNTASIEVSNNGKDNIFIELLNPEQFKNYQWFINDKLIDEDLAQIVYYRNMEFSSGKRAELLFKGVGTNGCPALFSTDVSKFFNTIQKPVIPTVITPNNDGLNDKWIIEIEGETHFTCKVVDRSNKILFYTTDKNDNWDGFDRNGEIVPAGSYIYIIEYQFPNEGIQTKTGIIQIIRN